MQIFPEASDWGRRGGFYFFVNLRRQQQGGGLQDRQREGDAEEDSLYRPTMSACVFSARQKGKVPNCKRISDLKKVAVI